MSERKRYKQSYILPDIEAKINLMPEAGEHGFTYAANLALSRYFDLPAPELPAKRIARAVRSVDREIRSEGGKLGAKGKWNKK